MFFSVHGGFGLECTYIASFYCIWRYNVVGSATCWSICHGEYCRLSSMWHDPSVFMQDMVETD